MASAATLSAGVDHGCAVGESAGEIRCWGRGTSGQIGNGKLESRAAPTAVASGVQRWSAVDSGGVHSCGLTAAGGVYCWGGGSYGQLGNGSVANQTTPTPVTGLGSGVLAIALAGAHSCALLQSGRINCWGYGMSGRLGTGNNSSQSVPVEVVGIDTAVAIAAGHAHTCALLANRTMKCWGYNDYGSLGSGTATSNLPVDVAGVSDVVEIALGEYHSCARTSSGGLLCWGLNNYGQIGDGTHALRDYAVPVNGMSSGVLHIAAGGNHSCAVRVGATTHCWGSNGAGQLGDGTQVERPTPTSVAGLPAATTELNLGARQTCARSGGNTIHCWGSAEYGSLASGTTTAPTHSLLPRQISGLRAAPVELALQGSTACARTETGSAHCWGANESGQIGQNDSIENAAPREVENLQSSTIDIAAGAKHACAVRADGSAWCWGYNSDGQLGDGTTTWRYTPVAVSGITDAVQVEAGFGFSCARTAAGGVWCWGDNLYGQLGNGSTVDSALPVPVSDLAAGAVALSLGERHACALKDDAKVVCWGYNSNGQLGDGTLSSKSVPTPVSDSVHSYISIATAAEHSCGVTTAGQARCWGANASGQLGDGSTTRRPVPTGVQGFTSGVTRIAAGGRHTCALRNATLYCWGLNGNYQLGDMTTTTRLLPVPAQNLPLPVHSFALSATASCAVLSDRIGRCWGGNANGQSGSGSDIADLVMPEAIAHWLRDDLIFRDHFQR